MKTSRKIALGLAGAVLVAGSTFGIIASSQAEPTVPEPTDPASGAPQQGGFGHGRQAGMPGQPGGAMGQGQGHGGQGQAAYLAEQLGQDQAEVEKALTDYRATHTPATRGRNMDDAQRTAAHDALAKYLAEKLGVEETAARTALDGMHAARQTERTQEMQSRLDDAVKEGKLSQGEADAIRKAHESGVMGFGRGHR